MSRKRARSFSPALQPTSSLTPSQTFLSASIKDRSSNFIALYSPTASAKSLQAHADFSTASHRIAAWRTLSKQRSLQFSSQRLYESGHDDDGEKYAGKKLEKVLEDMNAEGAVVVARWYGGIMLGPVRFTHIENCAREAISKSRAAENDERTKKRKTEEDEKVTAGLVRVLQERDQSIIVLRALLVEKTTGASADPGDKIPTTQAPTPTKQIDYSAMPLQALKQLDKARDATITWILKKIDEAEEQQKPGTGLSEGSATVTAHSPTAAGDV